MTNLHATRHALGVVRARLPCLQHKSNSLVLIGFNMKHDENITKEGAQIIALAFEMLYRNLPAKDVLTATAKNLGLTQLGKKGETIVFVPRNHEDLDGGMLPGDSAMIEEPGWLFGKDLIARAKVRKG